MKWIQYFLVVPGNEAFSLINLLFLFALFYFLWETHYQYDRYSNTIVNEGFRLGVFLTDIVRFILIPFVSFGIYLFFISVMIGLYAYGFRDDTFYAEQYYLKNGKNPQRVQFTKYLTIPHSVWKQISLYLGIAVLQYLIVSLPFVSYLKLWDKL